MIPIYLNEEERRELYVIYECIFILNSDVENLNIRCENLETLILNHVEQLDYLTNENEHLKKNYQKVINFCKNIEKIGNLAVKVLTKKQKNTSGSNHNDDDEIHELIKRFQELRL